MPVNQYGHDYYYCEGYTKNIPTRSIGINSKVYLISKGNAVHTVFSVCLWFKQKVDDKPLFLETGVQDGSFRGIFINYPEGNWMSNGGAGVSIGDFKDESDFNASIVYKRGTGEVFFAGKKLDILIPKNLDIECGIVNFEVTTKQGVRPDTNCKLDTAVSLASADFNMYRAQDLRVVNFEPTVFIYGLRFMRR